MEIKEFSQSKTFRVVVIVVGVFLVALVSFATGVKVGFHKAKFSYAFGENYERNFVGDRRGMMSGGRGGMMERFGFFDRLDERDFRNAHGLVGEILSVTADTLIVKDRDGQENSVAITSNTLVKRGRDTLAAGDLQVGDRIVVIGQPSEKGVVNADLIRVFGQENDK